MKTSSILTLSLALVSKKLIPKESAKSYPSLVETSLSLSKSLLFPTKNRTALGPACFLISVIQLLMLLKEFLSVIS